MPKNLTKDLRKEIIALYNSGYNISTIAKELKHTRRTVRRWVNRPSLEDRYRAPNHRIIGDDRLQKLIDIYKKNPLTPTKVAAKEFNCSSITIRSALRRAGIRFRVLKKEEVPSNKLVENPKIDHRREQTNSILSDKEMSLGTEKIEIEIDLRCPITDPMAFVSTEMDDTACSDSKTNKIMLPSESQAKLNILKHNKDKGVKLKMGKVKRILIKK